MTKRATIRGLRRYIPVRLLFLSALITGCTMGCATAEILTCRPPAAQRHDDSERRQVLYTDIASGPTTGGEDDLGIYLSVFGVHFWDGSTGPGIAARNQIKVSIGRRPVAAYRYFGVSFGRPDIQQITVQIGPLLHVVPGVPLPVVVEVAGRKSNANIRFIPNPGSIYFVDNVRGVDSTGVSGDIAHPFRTHCCARRLRICPIRKGRSLWHWSLCT